MNRLDEAKAALDAARAERHSEPLDLFGTPAELARVTNAIGRAHRHSSNAWKQAALEAVNRAALAHDELTVEDVDWPTEGELDDRARGGIMRTAAHRGWIVTTKRYTTSTRPETHHRPLLLWRSTLRDTHQGRP